MVTKVFIKAITQTKPNLGSNLKIMTGNSIIRAMSFPYLVCEILSWIFIINCPPLMWLFCKSTTYVVGCWFVVVVCRLQQCPVLQSITTELGFCVLLFISQPNPNKCWWSGGG